MTDKKIRILPTVQKPARYTGGEWGEVRKNKGEMAVRVAFCFRIPMRSACPMWVCGSSTA